MKTHCNKPCEGQEVKKEIKAAKTHSCEKCGCNIYKGQMHHAEPVYIPVTYDCEFETKYGGYTAIRRFHIHRSQCDIAIREVQEHFEKTHNNHEN